MRLVPGPCYHGGVVQRGGADESRPLWKEDGRSVVEEKASGAGSHSIASSHDDGGYGYACPSGEARTYQGRMSSGSSSAQSGRAAYWTTEAVAKGVFQLGRVYSGKRRVSTPK